jgi:hypothetical protein
MRMDGLNSYFFVQHGVILRCRNGRFLIVVKRVGMLCSRRGMGHRGFFRVLAERHSDDLGFGMWGDAEMLNPYHVFLAVGYGIYSMRGRVRTPDNNNSNSSIVETEYRAQATTEERKYIMRETGQENENRRAVTALHLKTVREQESCTYYCSAEVKTRDRRT